jgi:hypothetical protein
VIGLDNAIGPRPCLVAEDVERLQRYLAAGFSTRQVAITMGIHRRTAYRYRHARIEYVQAFGQCWALLLWRPGAEPRIIDQRQERTP